MLVSENPVQNEALFALCLAQGPTFKNPQKKLPKIECFTILSSGHSLSPEVSCPTSNMIELDDEVFLSPNNNSRGSEQSLIYDPIEALKCYRRMIEVQVLNLFMTKFLRALSVGTKHVENVFSSHHFIR